MSERVDPPLPGTEGSDMEIAEPAGAQRVIVNDLGGTVEGFDEGLVEGCLFNKIEISPEGDIVGQLEPG